MLFTEYAWHIVGIFYIHLLRFIIAIFMEIGLEDIDWIEKPFF